VEEHYAARLDLIHQPIDHPFCVMVEPVVSVQVPGDNLVAEPKGV
jgi:hypothetical protein